MENTDNKVINKDYIGVVLENDNGLLEYSQISIDRNPVEKEIIKISNIHDRMNSIFDMQSSFRKAYPLEKTLDYIYPFEYNIPWIDGTHYPCIYESSSVHKYLTEPFDELPDQCERDIINILNTNLNLNYNNIEDVFTEYLYKRVQIQNYLRYIYAADYTNKVSEIKQEKRIKMYSTDTLGHSTFKYVINKDITIIVKTNFGYGKAAYFVCLLKYKNVTILPYTVVVNYYLVNWTKLLKCTRDYYPRRENWNFLFEYVVRIANLIKTDLEGFKNEVLNDVKTMVDGLEETFRTPETCLQRFLNVKKEDFELSRRDKFRIVKIVSERGIQQYKVYPEEKVLVFKVAKITGCLELLDNLRQLKEFIPEIGKYRQRIKELNTLIAPEISAAIANLNVSIESMEKDLQIMIEQFDVLLKKIHQKDLMLNKHVLKEFDEYKSFICTKFLNKDYDYFKNHRVPILQENFDLYSNIRSLEIKLEYRKQFLERLEKGKSRIEQYLHIK